MTRYRAGWAVIALIAVAGAAVAILQPGYRVESQCSYLRGEEGCRCYSACIYRTFTERKMYRPPAESRQCGIIRAFPIFEKEDTDPRVLPTDPSSKDPCKNGKGMETYGSGEEGEQVPKKEP